MHIIAALTDKDSIMYKDQEGRLYMCLGNLRPTNSFKVAVYFTGGGPIRDNDYYLCNGDECLHQWGNKIPLESDSCKRVYAVYPPLKGVLEITPVLLLELDNLIISKDDVVEFNVSVDVIGEKIKLTKDNYTLEIIPAIKEEKVYTLSDLIRILEDVYCKVAEDYNDHGKREQDFEKDAVKFVENYISS